jgi:predicted ArsR family transcriptional regulator
MKTVRQQVLEYITARRVVTAEEIARSFKMTRANARHHLAVLLDEGAVEISGAVPDGSPGRPPQHYRPTNQIRQHNLDRLARALLQTTPPELKSDAWLMELAEHLLELPNPGVINRPNPPHAEHLSKRLAHTVRQLNQMNYDARWEAHAQAPRVIFNHCPYRAIVDEHPELCRMDALVLQRALRVSVTQLVKLGRDSKGLSYCQFAVGSLLSAIRSTGAD